MTDRSKKLNAGAAVADITPETSMFLFGYPHVERYSTGVHDRLLSSALYLNDGADGEALFIANDIIFIPKALAHNARRRIEKVTGVKQHRIMITATHTHSGPITVDYLSNRADSTVPPADPEYLQRLEDCIVDAAIDAHRSAVDAILGLAVADVRGIGTNRRDPAGKADPAVPTLVVRELASSRYIACMVVCSMHPTVLHEDSTLISGDFPAMARQQLQHSVLGENCPVLHHTGPCGDQSPRHVTRANTFAEARRLGQILATAVERTIGEVEYREEVRIAAAQTYAELSTREFPSVDEACHARDVAAEQLRSLRQQAAAPRVVRKAEVDWFGAEELVALARAAQDGHVEEVAATCLPAEIQMISIGPWRFIGWPTEIFVEFALVVKSKYPRTFIVSLANGEMQGYVVDENAAMAGGYEANNGLFGPECGRFLVERTLALLENTRRSSSTADS